MANSLRPAGSRHAWLSRRRVTLAGLVGLVVAAAVVLPMRGPRNATADFLTLSDPMFVNARLVEQWLGRSGQLRALMARSDESWLGPWLQAPSRGPSAIAPANASRPSARSRHARAARPGWWTGRRSRT